MCRGVGKRAKRKGRSGTVVGEWGRVNREGSLRGKERCCCGAGGREGADFFFCFFFFFFFQAEDGIRDSP